MNTQDPNTFTIKKFVFIGISGLVDKFEQNQTGGKADKIKKSTSCTCIRVWLQ